MMARRAAGPALLFTLSALAAEPGLYDVLESAGRRAEKLQAQVSTVACNESVTQSKLDAKGKTTAEIDTLYDSVVLLASKDGAVQIDESRVERERKLKGKAASLLVTNGFSLLALVLHPAYQSSFEFARLPDDMAEGRRLVHIAFRYVDGRSPSELILPSGAYSLHWSGTAWLDASTYSPVRIQAELGDSVTRLGLERLEADVSYSEMRFAGVSDVYCLPTRAVIEAATPRQRWRNVHTYSGYRLFSVETTVRGADSK